MISKSGIQPDETDEYFFGTLKSSTNKSNLASLFDLNKQTEDSHQSLKYEAPKQVQKLTDAGGNPEDIAWSVQIAKVVTAFKLINQENISQGKVGLALLKNSMNDFKLIIYRTKSNILATITLQKESQLIFKSSYLQFNDDSQQFWSIFLESSDEKLFIDHLPSQFVSIVENKEIPATIEEPQATQLTTDDSGNDSKEKLLLRMAKMGKSLPKLAPSSNKFNDISDSSDTEIIKIPAKPNIIPRKPTKQLIPINNSFQAASIATYAPLPPESQYMNMLLTENRTQNTELRMNISKLETKIEKVLDKIELIGCEGNTKSCTNSQKDDEILELEEKLLELKKENRSLRKVVRELEIGKSNSVESAIKLNTNLFFGFENVLEELDVNFDDCKDLEDMTINVLKKCQSKLQYFQNIQSDLAKSKAQQALLTEKVANLSEMELQNIELQNKLDILKKQNEDLANELRQAKSKQNEGHENETIIKQIMNNLYGEIAAVLENQSHPLTNEGVLCICGGAIRKETMRAVQESKK